jgi:hypothetical protein
MLSALLRRFPSLWGWSVHGDRHDSVRCAFEQAFPCDDSTAFVKQTIAARSRALAASMIYMARTQAGRSSALVKPLMLTDADETPYVVTYLHYAIDPTMQLSLLAANPDRRFRWVVYPPPPNRPLRWEDERDLYLAGSTIPESIRQTMLYITEPSWLIEALRHVRRGGSIFIALDAPLNSRRPAVASLKVGQATLPISPAIDLLASSGKARLLFVWPELRPDDTWHLSCECFPHTSALAAAASQWIDTNRIYWAAWSCLTIRLLATDMRGAAITSSSDGVLK